MEQAHPILIDKVRGLAEDAAAAAAKSLQSCPTLCDTDFSPPGSAVPGILQARTLERVAISFSIAWKWKWSHSVVSDSSDPMDCSPPGSAVPGLLQARTLERVVEDEQQKLSHEWETSKKIHGTPLWQNLIILVYLWIFSPSNYVWLWSERKLCILLGRELIWFKIQRLRWHKRASVIFKQKRGFHKFGKSSNWRYHASF